MDESDESLAARSRRGDRSAFEELVRRTGRLVFARLYLDTGNPHEAEDLTQETFLLACRQIHRLDDPAAFRSWILAIARNVYLDAIKNRKRKKRSLPGNKDSPRDANQPADQLASRSAASASSNAVDEVADEKPTPSENAEQSEQRLKVLSALRALPEDYQRPLSLRYLAGSDYETISRQLGLTNGSLRGLLHRGLEMLREKMKPQ